MKIGNCLIDVSWRRSLLREQFLGAGCVHFRQFQRSLRVGQVAFRLRDRGLKKRRIDLRDHLSSFHLRIKIHEQLRDISRDLTAHLHVDHGIQPAGRSDGLGDGAARYCCGLIICSAAVPALPDDKRENEQPGDEGEPG
jgi:hypothetical protein